MTYVPHTEPQIAKMLSEIGVERYDDLIKAIPEDVRLEGGLDLPDGLSELEVMRHFQRLAEKNREAATAVNFLGGGAYDHFIPAAVGAITSRSEWYTAYTPYQAEVAQGTLQAIYEYQSVICDITGMDVANASVYDGPTAAVEAMLMALRSQRKRARVVVSDAMHPHTLKLLDTYAETNGIEVTHVPMGEDGRTDAGKLAEALGDDVAVVHFQHPNFFGVLEDAEGLAGAAHEAGALVASSIYPASLGVLAPPGQYGADIATGEGQCLGNALGFGGPYLGVFAAREKLIRQMPGRIAGRTEDLEGRPGFVLTLQTREQHIRRGKATSNICTNQGLNALAALVHLALLGKEGFRRVGELAYHKAHYLHSAIVEQTDFQPVYDAPFFNEFVLRTPIPAAEAVDRLADMGILGGVRLDRFYPDRGDQLLVAVTEKRSREELDRFVSALGTVS